MLKFRVQINEHDETVDVVVGKHITVQELKTEIYKQAKLSNDCFDIYIFGEMLKDGSSINKIVYSPDNDYLSLKYHPKQNFMKLAGFLSKASQLIKKKTMQATNNLAAKVVIKRASSLLITPMNKPSPLQRLMTFFQNAQEQVMSVSKLKAAQFGTKLKQGVTEQLSVIQREDDQHKNNDTVLNLLDDMIKKKMNPPQNKSKERKIMIQHNPSPQALEYLRRKQRAEDQMNDPIQQLKAKLLVAELKRQRQYLEYKKQEQLDNKSEQLESSLEYYQRERQQQQEQLNQEKRDRIKQRLEDMKRFREKKKSNNEHSKQVIAAVKLKMKQEQAALREKEISRQHKEDEEARLILDERRKIAQPIRLPEISKHAEKYFDNLQRMKLEKDQEKLEREIKIQQETKQLYKARKVLDVVLKSEDFAKQKDAEDLRKKQAQLRRKLKYAEIIKEFHMPEVQRSELDGLQQSKIEKQYQLDISQQDQDLAELLRGKDQSARYTSLSKNAEFKQSSINEKNLNKIKSVLSNQDIRQSRVTESLKVGKMPDPSVYYQKKIKEEEVPVKKVKQKHQLYLQIMRKERELRPLSINDNKSAHLSKKSSNQQFDLQHLKRIETEARRKEEIALVQKDEKLQDEATDLFLQSIKAKLQYLDKIA